MAKDSRSASQKWKSSIYQEVQRLGSFPRIGRMVPEANRDDVREIFYGKYRIIYRIDQNRISILTVRHGKQLLDRDEISYP
ncbi:MAG: type II toxin-antitoxin system RelE/ParE family toxin [bacterium]